MLGYHRFLSAPGDPISSMFSFIKRNKSKPTVPEQKKGLLQGLKSGLSRTRERLFGGLGQLFSGKSELDEETLEEVETLLLGADVGIEATRVIIEGLRRRHRQEPITDAQGLTVALSEEMRDLLEPVAIPLEIPTGQAGTYVILMVGVNGTGKTTTIAKLAQRFLDQGLSVMLAAGDTFRAAAIEQLQSWGKHHNVPVIAQQHGADPASVVFDALQSAQAHQVDVLIADTAGRLHTQTNLMQELKKISRVMGKLDPGAPHETLLVLDAGTGQNALAQAEQFHQAVQLTGITLTKLDGTARGGIVFSLARRLGLPIRFIGIGEKPTDLRVFNAPDFIAALLDEDA